MNIEYTCPIGYSKLLIINQFATDTIAEYSDTLKDGPHSLTYEGIVNSSNIKIVEAELIFRKENDSEFHRHFAHFYLDSISVCKDTTVAIP
jgi:hypothetical protein